MVSDWRLSMSGAVERLRGMHGNVTVLEAARMADEIQAEIDELDERYVPLPVDADGKIIRPGDSLVLKDGEYGIVKVKPVLLNSGGWSIAGHWPEEFVHLKPRSVEDVLRDYKYGNLTLDSAEVEIRALIGGES